MNETTISTQKSEYSFERSELRCLQSMCNATKSDTMSSNDIFLNRLADMIGELQSKLEASNTRAALAEHTIRMYERYGQAEEPVVDYDD